MKKFSHINAWVFDLDNTLYDAEPGVFPRLADKMTNYVGRLLNVPDDVALHIRQKYWKDHGTTLRGIMNEHKVDPHHFLAETHDIDISDVPRCPVTIEYLDQLPGKRIVFTNSCRSFADRMLKHLGIDGHFDHLYSIEDANFMPKPQLDPYHDVIRRFNVDPARACMFEDMEINLKTAADLGMTTVWFYGKNKDPGQDLPHVHHRAEKLADWLQQTVKKK